MNQPPNRILEFLTAKPQPEGDACRTNRRRRSASEIQFAWSEGPDWRTVRARLRDISRGGASLFATQPPPLTRRARIRFVEGEGSPWVEAEVLEVVSDSRKRHRVRIRFESPCPSFILRLAVLGLSEAEDEVVGMRYEWVAVDPDGMH